MGFRRSQAKLNDQSFVENRKGDGNVVFGVRSAKAVRFPFLRSPFPFAVQALGLLVSVS